MKRISSSSPKQLGLWLPDDSLSAGRRGSEAGVALTEGWPDALEMDRQMGGGMDGWMERLSQRERERER